jgi:hypothetical protein
MRKVDTSYDVILGVNYTLHAIRLSELKTLAKSWYGDFDLKAFDTRDGNKYKDEASIIQMKLSGVVSNYFYAYQEDDEFYLLDGYNRLFTDYGELDVDPQVYIKIIIDKCSDHKMMSIMFRLNMWKLSGKGHNGFETHDFFDRGFRLFIQKKFGIDIYNGGDYHTRTRRNPDFRALDYYFRRENKLACYWKLEFKDVVKLFSHKNVINDIREIVTINDYLEPPFTNYETFLNGYIMFLSWRRVSGDDGEYNFNDYLEILKQDKFYKKLIKMSGTDSTRINVYNFFRRIHQENIKK